MTEHEDAQWLDGLRGAAGANTDAPAFLEGEALRNALVHQRGGLSEIEGRDAQHGGPDPARENALIARAIREGLIPRRSRPSVLMHWRPLLAAAALAVIAVGVIQWRQATRDIVVVERGSGAVTITTTDPSALKASLLAQLRAAGVQASGYESLGAEGIDADLPQPLTAEIRRVLESHAIPAPDDGVLRIEIRQKE